MKDKWYHNAVIYSLDVETFMDSNDDGIGDFTGVVSKLDHLAGLGINCLWLRPFFPSPMADDGYDVMDYYNINPRYGNLGDFVDLLIKANAFGIQIIIDLVVNHTSIEHKWFQQSRADSNSKYRDYYIWKKKLSQEDQKEENMLEDGSIWTFDQKAKAYYMHHFYKEQPDLNIANPEVRKEIIKIMGFWLQMGVSGFRIDAAHIMVHETKDNVFEMLEEMRTFIESRNPNAILLAEANVEADEIQPFFGSKNGQKRMHLMFNFLSNKNMFLCFARQSAEPLIKALELTKNVEGEWVNFIRHHDELNLEMLTDEECKEVHQAFAPEEHMIIFGHGIRRRLPPMFNGDRRLMELMYAVMFSLPGIPLINYGEEIGMGDNLSLKGRDSVRTSMQWDGRKNAGFSTASPDKLLHPVIDFGDYDYKNINVAIQQKDPESFLNWVERLISTRKHSPLLCYGSSHILKNNNEDVLSFYAEWENEACVMFSNFKDKDCEIKIRSGKEKFENVSEIFSNIKYTKVDNLQSEINLSGYGYRWFKCNITS
jgi:maltose alpha-D-glucosyltransferase / alpha-amylase